MEFEEEENILNKLKTFDKKDIVICQTGFINSRFTINCLKYKVEYDILKLEDKYKVKYITINLNQIYKYEIKDKKIVMNLDNDIVIELYII